MWQAFVTLFKYKHDLSCSVASMQGLIMHFYQFHTVLYKGPFLFAKSAAK